MTREMPVWLQGLLAALVPQLFVLLAAASDRLPPIEKYGICLALGIVTQKLFWLIRDRLR